MDRAKPFDIPKREVWEAYKKVRANQAAAGVDGQSIADFEADLANNLYKLCLRLRRNAASFTRNSDFRPAPHRLRVGVPRRSPKIRHLSATRVQNYMWIATVICAMSAAAAFVILKLVGVDFALTFALIVFGVKFIRTIGLMISVTATSLMALLEFDTIIPFLIVLVANGSIDSIIGLVILPALQGKSLNLSSLMGMVSLAF